MINTMKDILQYLPYALFLAAVFALLAGGVIATYVVFRRNDKRFGKNAAETTKI